jgi:hypothetical protein
MKTRIKEFDLHGVVLILCMLCTSCVDSEKSAKERTPAPPKHQTSVHTSNHFHLTDKSITFLWREDVYSKTYQDTFSSIVINEDFCKHISAPEKAALGYVATFIGNECRWEDDYKEDRSNLKCKVLTALGLGYQCSDKHLGFLRKLFKKDAKALERLRTETCPTTPDGATSQNTFDKITLTVKGNDIWVIFKAEGIHLREGKSWSWTEKVHFRFDTDNIKILKTEVSDFKRKNI